MNEAEFLGQVIAIIRIFYKYAKVKKDEEDGPAYCYI